MQEKAMPVRESHMSSAIQKLLHDLAQARGSLRENNGAAAKLYMNRTYLLIEIIRGSSPAAQAREYVMAAKKHLSYQENGKAIEDLMTVYPLLDDMENLYPVGQARNHVVEAERNVRKHDSERARRELELAGDTLVCRELDIPLSSAEGHIAAAQSHLSGEEFIKADQALKAAENELGFIIVELYAPLPQARKNLRTAVRGFAVADYGNAKRGLNRAERYLVGVIETGDEKAKMEAKDLLKEIDHVRANIDRKEVEGVREVLEGLWWRATALIERQKEYIFLSWEESAISDPAKKDLIEAEFHLYNVQTFHVVTGETQKAQEEMSRAEHFLKSAQSQMDEKHGAEVLSIGQELKSLRSELKRRDESVKRRYDAIEDQLKGLIRTL